MTKYILTVNISSSGADACVFDDKFQPASHVFLPISQFRSEFHPDEIISSFIDCVRRTLVKMKSKSGIISGICISAEPYSYIGVDRNNNPLTLISLWGDVKTLTKSEAKHFGNKSVELHKITGCPVSSYFPFKRLFCFKMRNYEKYSSVYKYLSLKSYLISVLTGKIAEDYATASSSGLFDIHDKIWSFDALKILEITDAGLPPLKSPYEVLGYMSGNISRKCGLPNNIPLILGSSSIAAVNLGSGVRPSEEICINMDFATSVQVLSPFLPKLDDEEALWYNLADEDTYIWGGTTNAGNGVIRHFLRTLFPGGINPQIFIEEMKNRFMRLDGPLCFPFFRGERTPFWDSEMRGIFSNMSYETSSLDFMYSIFESIAFCIYGIIRRIQNIGGRFSKIKLISNNEQWGFFAQFLADILDRPIEYTESKIIPCLGGAISAKSALNEKINPLHTLRAASFIEIEPNKNIYTSINEKYEYWHKELSKHYNAQILSESVPFAPEEITPLITSAKREALLDINNKSALTSSVVLPQLMKEKTKLAPLSVYKLPNIAPEERLQNSPSIPGVSPSRPGVPSSIPGVPPSLSRPGVPSPPSMPGVSPSPSRPGVPSPPSMPGVSPSPSRPGVPSPPSMPGVPSPPSMPGVPSPPSMPGVPSPPSMPGVPSPPSMPGVPSPPSMPGVSSPPSMPGVPSPPSMPGVPSPPSMPGVPSPPPIPGVPSPPPIPGVPSPPPIPGVPPPPPGAG